MKIGIIGLSGQSYFLRCPHFHREGETVCATSFHAEPGGKGYNQAIAARRLGAEVFFVSCVGSDAFGSECAQRLAQEGVEARLQTVPALPTACAFILTDDCGRNRVTVHRGAANALSAAFVRECESSIAACDLLLLGLECPSDTLHAAVELGARHSLPLLLNPAPATALATDFLHRFSLLTPNEQEAGLLFGCAENAPLPVLAQTVLHATSRTVVVTLGSRGALLLHDGAALHFPALPVQAVDTTGAGDCFSAALAVALCRRLSLEEAVVFALNAAARSVAHPFAIGGMPTLPAVQEHFCAVSPRCVL